VAQSVELLLDDRADAAVRREWNLLADAGLPSELRSGTGPGSENHRPHLTLFAADAVPESAERALPDLVADLELEIQLGGVLLFGPRRGKVILVRAVTASVELLALQSAVGGLSGADPDGQFGPGRWTPHVTLARRLGLDQVGEALVALDRTVDRPLRARIVACRRWDGVRKTAWLL
jgi:2'-5' RNA ligase